MATQLAFKGISLNLQDEENVNHNKIDTKTFLFSLLCIFCYIEDNDFENFIFKIYNNINSVFITFEPSLNKIEPVITKNRNIKIDIETMTDFISINNFQVQLNENQICLNLGLILMFYIALNSVRLSEIYQIPTIVKDGNLDYWAILFPISLISPIIWFTWFSVRQYSHNTVLIEDYAFKEASALAFVGYKKDMEDDLEMVKLLRESAIHNFSYAPSRLISKSDAVSPLHDLIEKACQDKGMFERVISLLNAVNPKK